MNEKISKAQRERMILSSQVDRHEESVIKECEKAIKGMENAVQDAKRFLGDGVHPYAPTMLPERILHIFAWGFANSSTDIENAIRDASELNSITARISLIDQLESEKE